ncbi:MAG: tRNA (cytidine(34)-2'-O)-methyltransferase [Gammaproteobacteria bacterium]
MFNIALFEPEIPPNTGNIIRLCANCGANLHLIHPLGFTLEEKQLRRARLDYSDFTSTVEHDNYDALTSALDINQDGRRIFACSTKGKQAYHEQSYRVGDSFLFGPETRGLPNQILEQLPTENIIRIPMLPNNRSINLANAVSIIVYEAWRQTGFSGITND